MTEADFMRPIPGETHKAYLAFTVYRDLGAERSLDRAYQLATGKSGRHARHWAAWSSRNRWVTRSQAYDNAIADMVREKVQRERIDRFVALYGDFF